jgi:DNA (cytosine-5)-methyltransferase 1
VFENVTGIKPENLLAVQSAFAHAGYRRATRIIDAEHFLPQSRERYFIIGAHESLGADPAPFVAQAMNALPERSVQLNDIIDFDSDFRKYPAAEVKHHLAMLNSASARALRAAQMSARPSALPFARRTRYPGGRRTQTVEIRQGGVANALKVVRKGGSSHQFLFIVRGDEVSARAIDSREAARLMGLPDSYVLPRDPIAALDLCGDGVVVPVVRFLVERVIEPLLANRPSEPHRSSLPVIEAAA